MNIHYILQESGAVLTAVGRSFWHLLPYLALSIPLAVALKRSGAAAKIRKGLGSNPFVAVVLATLIGALSPFCSCGVIPIIASLLVGGVPLAPVMAFWLASPSMDPEIFVLSVGSIGWELAIWRLAGTFVMSLGGGLIVFYLEKRKWLGTDVLRRAMDMRAAASQPSSAVALAAASCCAGSAQLSYQPLATARMASACGCGQSSLSTPSSSGCSTAESGSEAASPAGRSFDLRGLAADTLRTTATLSLYMLLAFLLEALIIRYVPQHLIASSLGSNSVWSVPFAALIGIPMYTTNLTSLGLISGLLKSGMSGGAALAFLIGGAVTTLPAMSAVYGIVRGKVFALYLAFCIAGALLSGFIFQLVHSL